MNINSTSPQAVQLALMTSGHAWLHVGDVLVGGVICSDLEIIGGLGLSSRLIVNFQT
jgi:hypothetical protein